MKRRLMWCAQPRTEIVGRLLRPGLCGEGLKERSGQPGKCCRELRGRKRFVQYAVQCGSCFLVRLWRRTDLGWLPNCNNRFQQLPGERYFSGWTEGNTATAVNYVNHPSTLQEYLEAT